MQYFPINNTGIFRIIRQNKDRFVLTVRYFQFFGYNSNNAVYPITKRKNKISTGRKPSKRIFVEMNVVPHMMIVNTAAKCPIILLLSVMSASFAYAGKNSVIRTGTDSDKLVKIMREMALVKKSGLTGDICGRYSFFQ